jgi:hypothetical protein
MGSAAVRAAGKPIGLRRKVAPLPAVTGFPAQAEGAGRQKRNADDVAEQRPVLVPADRRAGRVFCDEDLLKRAGRDTGEAFSAGANRGEKFGHILCFDEAAARRLGWVTDETV